MLGIKFKTIICALLPSALFLILCWLTPTFLYRYSNIGPVRDGQPIFQGHYTAFVNAFMQALIVLGVLFSIYVIYKSWKTSGKEKYILLISVALMIPIQYVVMISTTVELWGK